MTITGFPAMVSVALRERVEVLAAIRKLTVLVPVPVAPEETVIQLTGLDALQPQVLEEAPTVMLNKVLLAVIEIGKVGTANEQAEVTVPPA